MFDGLSGFFFGRDVFVSYSYDDSSYAEALAVTLQQRKFSVFLGGWGASVSEDLSPNVVRAAKRSRLLVVVATQAAVGSKAVQREIDIVSKLRRTVVPINVGGALPDRRRWPGADPVHEEQGVPPSTHVLERIENAAVFVRQEVRLRRFIGAIIAAAIAVIAGSAFFLQRARQAQAVADSSAAVAGQRVIASTRTLRVRNSELEEATTKQKRQTAIASALQTANDATLLLQREPARLNRAALLAVLSARQLSELGERALGTDSALRMTAKLLPIVHKQRVKNDDEATARSPNRRFLASVDGSRMSVFDYLRGLLLRTVDVGRAHESPSAISNDGRTVLTRNLVVMHNDLIWDQRVWRDRELIEEYEFKSSQLVSAYLSDDGTKICLLERRTDKECVITVHEVCGGQWSSVVRLTSPRGVTFSPSGRFVAVHGIPAGVWDWMNEAEPRWAPLDPGSCTDEPCGFEIRFDPSDETIVATSGIGPLQVWSWRDWPAQKALRWRSEDSMTSARVSFGNHGNTINYISDAGEPRTVRWIDGNRARIESLIDASNPSERGEAVALKADHDSSRVVVLYRDGIVTEFEDAQPIGRMSQPTPIDAVAFVGRSVVSMTRDQVWAWSGSPIGYAFLERQPRDGPEEKRNPGGTARLRFEPSGVIVEPLAGGPLVRLPDSEKTYNGNPYHDEVETRDAAFAGDDRVFYTTSSGYGCLFSWRDQRTIWRIRNPTQYNWQQLDPTQKFIVAESGPNALTVYAIDGSNLRPVCSLRQPQRIGFYHFSSTGEFLATVDGTVARVWSGWNTSSPVEVARIASRDLLMEVKFSPDDRYLITESLRAIERYAWRYKDFLPQMCARLDRLIDPSDRPLFSDACPSKTPPLRDGGAAEAQPAVARTR